jgi:hypothetical protein
VRRAAVDAATTGVLIVCGACAGLLRSPDSFGPHKPRQSHWLHAAEAARVHAEAAEQARRFHTEAHRAAMEAAQSQTPMPVPQP